MRRAPGLVLASALSFLVLSTPARAEPPAVNPFYELGALVIHGSEADTLALGLGVYDAIDNESAPAATVEYRLGRKLWFLGLAAGGMVNKDGGAFGYLGIYADLSLGPVYLTLLGGVGGYHEGDSRDLGGVFQFREAIDLAYRFESGHRLGAKITHISNADLHERNPGEEEIYLVYSIPIGPIL